MKFSIHSRMSSLVFGFLLAGASIPIATVDAGAQRGRPGLRVLAPRTQMTVRQARTALVGALGDVLIGQVREVKCNRFGCGVSYAGDPPDKVYQIVFAPQQNLRVVDWSKTRSNAFLYNVESDGFGSDYGWAFKQRESAMMFADALFILRDAALAPDPDEAEFASFTAKAQLWLLASPKPEMSQEARTFKVVAEDAYSRRNFAAARDAYYEGLARHPMWPDGQFNAALLAAEAEDFEAAAMHMRRYLVLAPDAKDVEAANDKLLLWQHKAKEMAIPESL